MRLIIHYADSAAMNLAIEEAIMRAILEDKVDHTIRFWANPPCVVIGRYQVAALNCNLDYCKKNRIEIIRRESSGGAVYQDEGNWNHSIFVKNPENFVSKKEDLYEAFSSLMVTALHKLDIPAVFSPPNDILLNNKKTSGAAQFELYNTFLHHATLLVSTDLQQLAKALLVPNEKFADKNLNSILERVTTLEKEGYTIKDIQTLANEYKAVVENKFNVTVEKGNLTAFEKKLAEELYELKYKTEEWNIELIPVNENLIWFNYKIPTGLLQIGLNVSEKKKITEIVFTGDLSTTNFEIFNNIREKLLFAPLTKKELSKKLKNIDLSTLGINAEQFIERIVQAVYDFSSKEI